MSEKHLKQAQAKEKFLKTTYGYRAKWCLLVLGLVNVPFGATRQDSLRESAGLLKSFRSKALKKVTGGEYRGRLDAKKNGSHVLKLPQEQRYVYGREFFGQDFDEATLRMAKTLEAVMRALVEGCLRGVTAETRVGIMCALGCLMQVSHHPCRFVRNCISDAP